jgi:hypothetical protein
MFLAPGRGHDKGAATVEAHAAGSSTGTDAGPPPREHAGTPIDSGTPETARSFATFSRAERALLAYAHEANGGSALHVQPIDDSDAVSIARANALNFTDLSIKPLDAGARLEAGTSAVKVVRQPCVGN